MTLKHAISILKKNENELRHLGVKSLAVFGSVARGEAKKSSDIDLLVEFFDNRSIGLFEFFKIRRFLENILKCNVDMGTPQSLHYSLKKNILREAVRVN
jgi:predicted nucleotidyltransferase